MGHCQQSQGGKRTLSKLSSRVSVSILLPQNLSGITPFPGDGSCQGSEIGWGEEEEWEAQFINIKISNGVPLTVAERAWRFGWLQLVSGCNPEGGTELLLCHVSILFPGCGSNALQVVISLIAALSLFCHPRLSFTFQGCTPPATVMLTPSQVNVSFTWSPLCWTAWDRPFSGWRATWWPSCCCASRARSRRPSSTHWYAAGRHRPVVHFAGKPGDHRHVHGGRVTWGPAAV